MSNIAADMRRCRLKSCGHINRLTPNRLKNKVTKYLHRIKTTPWVKQVRAALEKARIEPTDVTDRNMYRHNTNEWKVEPEKEREKDQTPGMAKENREALSQKMKNGWKIMKEHRNALRYPLRVISR